MSLDAIKEEIRTYVRELPRLVAEGHAGRFVLIKGDDVLSVWDTFDDARQAGYERFSLGVAFLTQPIDPRDLHRTFPPDLQPRCPRCKDLETTAKAPSVESQQMNRIAVYGG